MNSRLFIRIDQKLKDRAKVHAKEKKTDVSKWIRRVIEVAIARADRKKK